MTARRIFYCLAWAKDLPPMWSDFTPTLPIFLLVFSYRALIRPQPPAQQVCDVRHTAQGARGAD